MVLREGEPADEAGERVQRSVAWEGGAMLRGRRHFTPRQRMILVAVAGFETLLFIASARIASDIYENSGIYYTIRTWLLTHLVFGLWLGLLRAAVFDHLPSGRSNRD